MNFFWVLGGCHYIPQLWISRVPEVWILKVCLFIFIFILYYSSCINITPHNYCIYQSTIVNISPLISRGLSVLILWWSESFLGIISFIITNSRTLLKNVKALDVNRGWIQGCGDDAYTWSIRLFYVIGEGIVKHLVAGEPRHTYKIFWSWVRKSIVRLFVCDFHLSSVLPLLLFEWIIKDPMWS